jgi:protein-disulfide isomerase
MCWWSSARWRGRAPDVGELTSATPPSLGPDDHVRGPADCPLVIEYADFECHFCRLTHVALEAIRLRRVFRHFPVRSKHPRAWAAAAAAEAAALQGRFWEMHDLLYADQGRLDDPHLWRRTRELGLDVDRFETDRRSEAVRGRIERDFDSGLRAGVVTTPTLFVDGRSYPGVPQDDLLARLRPAP